MKLKPPYLILPNHTNFWDPFLVSAFVAEPIHYVTSDTHFRNPLLRFLLKLVGAIPKTNFKSDFQTVKAIIKVKKSKGIIGVFPEGKRNWDGKSLELIYSTAKLVKNLKIPVIVPMLKGAYLSMPRWAKKPRKGKLTVSYKLVLEPAEISTMSVDEIYDALTRSLSYDEYYVQRSEIIPYKGKKLAERLELFLFTCPQCKNIGALSSHDNELKCGNCGYSVIYNKYGFLEATGEKLYFDNPLDWNTWQIDNLHRLIRNTTNNPSKASILQEEGVFLRTGIRFGPLKKFHMGYIELYKDRLTFTNWRKQNLSFNIGKISGINVQYNNLFEFYYEKKLYRFTFKSKNVSAYKWVKAVKMINENTFSNESLDIKTK